MAKEQVTSLICVGNLKTNPNTHRQEIGLWIISCRIMNTSELRKQANPTSSNAYLQPADGNL